MEYLEKERDKVLFATGPDIHELSEEERTLGMELLTSPRLFELIVEHMESLGYVGEKVKQNTNLSWPPVPAKWTIRSAS